MPIPTSKKIINGRTVTANDPNQTATKFFGGGTSKKRLRQGPKRFRTSKERQMNQAKFVSEKSAAVHVRKRRATRNTAITYEMLDAQVGEVPVVDATPE